MQQTNLEGPELIFLNSPNLKKSPEALVFLIIIQLNNLSKNNEISGIRITNNKSITKTTIYGIDALATDSNPELFYLITFYCLREFAVTLLDIVS
jgi:hypothetical protein